MLKINEIYYSLQGESTWTGLKCLFIRLTGCHLRCKWCDSEYSFFEGKEMTLEQILTELKTIAPKCKLVQITGGEPLLQKECTKLAEKLLLDAYTVLLETSGSLDIDMVPKSVYRIVDMKCPDSGMSEKNDYKNLIKLTERDELKFVIDSHHDFLWSCKLIKQYALNNKNFPLIISPTENISLPDLADWIKESPLNLRMQVQLHKLIWEKNKRRV